MASTRKLKTKDGRDFYEIRCRPCRDRPEVTTRWFVPAGWSESAIKRELAKQAAEFERKVKSGEILSRAEQKEFQAEQDRAAASIQTLKQYSEQVFIPSVAIRCSENTREAYQRHLKQWVYPHIGDLKMPDISSADLSAILLEMQSKGRAHSTVIKAHAILHSLFKSAYLGDVIKSNPMDKVARPRPRKDEIKGKETPAFSSDELKQILACLENEPMKWQAFVWLLAVTGVRRGEACGLQWQYVDFENNEITIAGNLCYTQDKGVYLDTPKSGRARTIPIAPTVTQMLKQIQKEQREARILSPYVFTQEGSPEPMHPQSPTRYFSRFGKRYGVPDFHPHKLRHTFASLAITNGADIASVSQVLGHHDKALTLRMYTHADQASMRRASETMWDTFMPEPKQA